MEKKSSDKESNNQYKPVWNRIESPDPKQRVDHASILYKEHIITFGGFNGSYLNDIVIFEASKCKWTIPKIIGVTPIPKCGHTMCLTNTDQIAIYGGRNENVLNELALITLNDSDGITIECQVIKAISENGPQRTYHSAVVQQNQMFIFGGKDQAGESTNQLWCVNLNTFNWTLHFISGEVPEKRYGHCCTLYQGKMYIFAGHSTQKKSKFNDLYVLDIDILKWKKITAIGLVPGPRSGTSVQQKDDKIYFFGGYKDNAECTNELFEYQITSNTWRLVKTSGVLPTPRCYHTSIHFKDKLFVWGGYDGGYLCDIFSLQLENPFPRNKGPAEAIIKVREGHPVLQKLFTEKRFADVTFNLNEKEILAHKAILSERCKFFENMFTSGMSESNTTKIPVSEVKASTFEAFIQFLYCDEVKVNEELAVELLQLSDKYLFPELKTKCEEFLASILREDNFIKLAKIAELFGAPKLKETILEFAAENSKIVAQNEELNDLPKGILIEIIGKFASKLHSPSAKCKFMDLVEIEELFAK